MLYRLLTLYVCYTVTVTAIEVFRQPNIILCPDQNYCQNTSTCCPIPAFKGSYGCCALPKAVCCDSPLVQAYCCPQGHHCVNKEPFCEKDSGSSKKQSRNKREIGQDDFTPLKVTLSLKSQPKNPQHLEVNPYKAGNDSVTCDLDTSGSCESGEKCCYNTGSSGNSSSNGTDTFAGCCPESGTCCHDSNGDYYGYCEVSNAACCSDEKSCCPSGYSCSKSPTGATVCLKGTTLDHKRAEFEVAANPQNNNNQVYRTVDTPTGKYVSKPYQLANSRIEKGSSYKNGGSGFTQYGYRVINDAAKATAIACDSNPVVYCHDGYTCCSGRSGEMCCPLEEAVCCADKKTCCPKGTSCDTTNHICTK